MNARAYIILLIIMELIPTSFSEEKGSQDYLDTYRKDFSDEFRKSVFTSETTDPPNSKDESSGDINLQLEETHPIKIVRNVLKPKKDGNFYKDELIEVLIKLTIQKKGGLKRIEFWEMPAEDLKISYCSYRIRTSNIQQMLDYEEQDSSSLQKKDIINATCIAASLNNNFLNLPERQKMNKYIYSFLSNNSTKLLNEFSKGKINESLKEMFKQNISCDFNKIIENNNTDLLRLFNECGIKVDYKNVSSLNPNSSAYNDLKDYRLQKRRILEHIYPKMLKNLSFSKEHERQNLVKNKNAIKIIEENIRQGETIIFKYYLHPTAIGLKEIRYILRADGYFEEDVETISVSEKGEKFSIDYWCDSKDIISKQTENFTFFIEYLGGNNETNSFDAVITPPDGCEINSISWKDISKPKFKKNNNKTWAAINVPFSKGKEEELYLDVVFYETGLRISPPTIKIGTYIKKLDPDLAIYADYDTPFKIHFEFLSIFLTIAAIVISLIVAIFSSVEIYLAHKEIRLVRDDIKNNNEQIELSRKDRIEANDLIDKNTQIFRKLLRKMR